MRTAVLVPREQEPTVLPHGTEGTQGRRGSRSGRPAWGRAWTRLYPLNNVTWMVAAALTTFLVSFEYDKPMISDAVLRREQAHRVSSYTASAY